MWAGGGEARVERAQQCRSRREQGQLRDRPDGHDPRDSHIGHKRIDLPVVPTAGAGALRIKSVRLNCLGAFEEPVHVKSFSLHKKTVPWE